VDSTKALSNERLGKLAKQVIFVSPSFGDKFELNASSPT
jgi:hypothetical protein